MKDDRIYLEHICEAMHKMGVYLSNTTQEQFMADEEKQDAVIRKIEIIGEATKRLSMPLRKQFPSIPWKALQACAINSFTTILMSIPILFGIRLLWIFLNF